MVKFFKRDPPKPEKCSICFKEKIIFKKGGAKGISLAYCRQCYDEYFARVKDQVMEQVQKAVKSKKMIGMQELKDLTNKITQEIEAEQAQKVIDTKSGSDLNGKNDKN